MYNMAIYIKEFACIYRKKEKENILSPFMSPLLKREQGRMQEQKTSNEEIGA
uniref:Uncharacterized protein n=1 Tax=Nelumbo nucifera TaxID=4432 RepID=A0A822XNY5_NELNU|nr:TPA_asm: hypothetical protein HUJ06_023583 [Nelumbo nucifera]